MTPMDVRYYPMGSIGAHVLGGVGGEGKGLEGTGTEIRIPARRPGRI